MQNNHINLKTSLQDSIYKLWKFKKVEPPQNYGGGMVSIDKYDLWDLTKKGILSYSLVDSPAVFHAIPYKLINNAIVLQIPDKQSKADDVQSKTGYVQFKTGDVQYKIKELTSTELKLIIHVTFNDQGKIQDFDMIELVFEAKE